MKLKINLVVQTAFLGDVILAIPLLVGLKKQFPSLPLGLVCRTGVGDFLKDLGFVDFVFAVKKNDANSYSEAINKINAYDVETVVCSHESIRTAFFIQKISAQTKIGFYRWWNFWTFNVRVHKKKNWPEPLRQLHLLSSLNLDLKKHFSSVDAADLVSLNEEGCLKSPPSWAAFPNIAEKSLHSGLKLSERSLLLFKKTKKTILIFPGSVWATKQWTEDGFTSLAYQLSSQFNVYLMGSYQEVDLCRRIAQKANVTSLAGQTSIMDSYQLISQSDLVVANDSAPAHLASLANIPLIVLFGPTVLDFGYRPWQNRAYVVQDNKLPCRPCGPHGHKSCPLGTHDCMKNISAKSVVDLARKILLS